MRRRVASLVDAPGSPAAAAIITLALGLFFSFVWAPHPWGWQGIDQYHELARALARGEPFGTTDVPWGYAYYVAAWYWLFGERMWLPVLGQVLANAAVPLLLCELIVAVVGRRTATLAALLIGVFSFNTIYASTQASDALCTVLFMASLVCIVRGHGLGRSMYFAAGGLIAGLVPQFRPNMVLLPIGLATLYVIWPPRRSVRVWHAGVYLFCAALALAPWTLRNYNLTGRLLPTSTHGGVQLWYGSLQVGPYLEHRASNPRAVFESPAFPYTSLVDRSIVVAVDRPGCGPWTQASVTLAYWTDRQTTPTRLTAARESGSSLLFEIPGQPSPTAVYYYAEASWPGAPARSPTTTPVDGQRHPIVYFVDTNHLGDLDRHDDLLDVFDLVRMLRQHDGRKLADIETAVAALVPRTAEPRPGPFVSGIEATSDATVLRLTDGGTLSIPTGFSGRVTDLAASGELAAALVVSWRPRWSLAPADVAAPSDPCRLVAVGPANQIFYRREVHLMGRYLALAFDNIGREPAAFAAASLYRALRLFVIRASSDWRTSHQFAGAWLVYALGELLSLLYFLLFLAGAVIAWRRRSAVLAALIPILYVPATISGVLTNMRYTTTVQPLLFIFIAIAIATLLKLDSSSPPAGHSSAALRSRGD